MRDYSSDQLEELLAAALASHDQGGDAAVAAFLAAHPAARKDLERGLARCRELGMLGNHAAAAPFPERLGEFRLLRRLGSGGMGVVYEAEQASLGRRVALKLVRPELLYFDGARERFRREIEAIARLSHPAIVPVLASGEHQGLPYFAMELLVGLSLQEVCARLAGSDPARLGSADLQALLQWDEHRTQPFPGSWWLLATRIGLRIAQGVQHAHLRGIVHRDIKPANIMLTQDGRAVLLDFGVARVGGHGNFTRSGNAPGSPAFMSPEQLRGDAVDERTDIYSLAATLWQLLTLEPPFPPTAVLPRQRAVTPPQLRSRNRAIPPELSLVLAKAMDPDRELRYPDMAAMLADLEAVLQRRPIQARRLPWTLRGLRFCQRHRTLATAVCCLALATLLLPALLAWQGREQNLRLAKAVASADESLQDTLQTIDRLLVTLASEQLRFVPQAQPVMVDALQQAVDLYAGLEARHPGDLRILHGKLFAQHRLAGLHQRQGSRDLALRLHQQILRELPDSIVATHSPLREQRATTQLNIASLHKEFGAYQQMLGAATAAAADFAELAGLRDHATTALLGQSQCELLRAEHLEATAGKRAALPALQAGVALVRAALATGDQTPRTVAALVRQLNNLATTQVSLRDATAARPLLAEAMQQARSLPADARIWPPPAVLLSDVLETSANLALQQQDASVQELFAECIALREQALHEQPQDIELATRLGGALHNQARTRCGETASEEDLLAALRLLDRAIELQRRVLRTAAGYERARHFLYLHLRLRGNCLVRLERRLELVEVARELMQDHDNANHLRATARFWLRAAAMLEPQDPASADHRGEYAAEALRALLAAESAGWHSNSQLDEAVYQPLAADEAFQALRQRLASKAAAAGEAQSGVVSPPSTSKANREMPR